MNGIVGDYGRTVETVKKSKEYSSMKNKSLNPVEQKHSGELYSDMPVVKLKISKEGRESAKAQVHCRPVRNNLGVFYSDVADPESLIAKERQAIMEEREQRIENEAFLEALDEEAMTALREFVMQYVRGSMSDISKMLAGVD